jgi:site-specific recombinase XerD
VGLYPNTRFHDLRYTFATLLLIKGVHLKIIQEMVGHFSITIALDTYIPRAFEHAGESSRDHGRYLRRVI